MANTYPGKVPFSYKFLNAYMADVSADSSAFVAVPCQGELIGVRSVLYGAITGANATVTIKVNGTAVTNGTLTITQSGSAAGDVDSVDFGAVAVKDGDYIEFDSDGGSSTTAAMMFTAIIRE